MSYFDQQVAELRKTVSAKHIKKKKAECSVEEWAAMLNYLQLQRERWNAANPEKRLEYSAKYRRNNLDKVRATCRASTAKWAKNNPDKARQSWGEWKQSNKERVREAAKLWESRNRDLRQSQRRDSLKNRLAKDEQFRMRHYLRCRISKLMSRSNASAPKAGSPVRDLGCTVAELWAHLESQFQPGMTRENWGVAWEVDHFYPLNQADMTDRVQFLAANNWRNLRPMTPAENSAKNDKVYPEAQALFDQLCAKFRGQVAA